LNIRQSTLRRRLRDLEYRLGANLFERTNGGTRLSLDKSSWKQRDVSSTKPMPPYRVRGPGAAVRVAG
jgi:hypothetical protein